MKFLHLKKTVCLSLFFLLLNQSQAQVTNENKNEIPPGLMTPVDVLISLTKHIGRSNMDELKEMTKIAGVSFYVRCTTANSFKEVNMATNKEETCTCLMSKESFMNGEKITFQQFGDSSIQISFLLKSSKQEMNNKLIRSGLKLLTKSEYWEYWGDDHGTMRVPVDKYGTCTIYKYN